MVAAPGLTVLGIPKITSGKQEDLVSGHHRFILMPIVVGGISNFSVGIL